jgi:hypothetical protein
MAAKADVLPGQSLGKLAGRAAARDSLSCRAMGAVLFSDCGMHVLPICERRTLHAERFALLSRNDPVSSTDRASTGCIASRSLQRLVFLSEFRLRNMHLNDYYLEAFDGLE